jgi:hypothetical protein
MVEVVNRFSVSLMSTSSGRDWMYRRIVPHIGHANHLCDLAESGRMSLDEMKTLIRDPHYICKKCGRAANKADNLCEPVPL